MVQEEGRGAEKTPHWRTEGRRVELHREERGQEGNSERPPLRDGQGWPLPDLSEMHGGGGVTAGTLNQDSRRKGEAT